MKRSFGQLLAKTIINCSITCDKTLKIVIGVEITLIVLFMSTIFFILTSDREMLFVCCLGKILKKSFVYTGKYLIWQVILLKSVGLFVQGYAIQCE